MSDSEFETIVPLNNKTGGAKAKKPVQKRKSDAANRSDSEREWEEIDAGTKKVKKPRQAKSPRTTSGASKKKTASNPFDVFELFPDDEAFAKNCPTPDQLRSSITQRVADGLTRRAADLEGEFFLELRVYNTADIRSELAEHKWKKALLAVKAQINNDTPQWEYLQKLTKHLRTLFDDAEVTFFHNKKG
ncbi:uncharacterized protein LOC125240784 isoform X1 [Leguminivora glycinivorella]|uniref:uncharacterized protein LOC125224687 isoform X1 n=1 Tax=Leguminivora glycinivorella TaxID=1035111 RepID=UPI00200E4890|nr:uncharacterized protein LOC125224687 isoform X1 [Leguminivora glycinivorella]XP_047985846.1 uncharacterized protein LOC125226056 isoform X1 [Leguminivora glycinivorella]XP_047989979.1 uncharacterized protein LOC125229227 isoform X1 [Leguminivora glycinivorella]XP_047996627.1 uncharacterized protein LOC125234433 isoform X1 [Leguminivora glycinivorella]XP_047997018.1 uncharacterized protein LOC125234705 isoform X1 [Leguminivora glycinivorella]XP_047997403.1 uncharacterized protein LOC12523499